MTRDPVPEAETWRRPALFHRYARAFLIPAVALILPALFPAALPGQMATPTPVAKSPALEDIDPMEVVRRMGLGWNLGNTMEACGDWITGTQVRDFETAWGNPETTKEIIDEIQAAGFRSVRIPVAWSNLMGRDHKIDPDLLDRVQEIVDWVLEDRMIAVVNIHWDSGWWSRFPKDYDGSMKRYRRIWSQITERFRDYPGTLILESLNEEGCFGDVWNRWGGGTPDQKQKAYGILNNINQAFVDLVRGSGGLNAKRHLLIAGYCTDIDLTVAPEFVMPKDPVNHLIVSVHYYTPFTFAGLEEDADWGKARPTWGTEEDLAELDANMLKVKTRFVDQGIPVIVGEYGSTYKNKDPESVRHYILSVTEKILSLGMCPMLWDAGPHFNRRTLEFNDPELPKGLRRILDQQGGKPDVHLPSRYLGRDF